MENNGLIEHKVGNSTFGWDTEKGKFYFDGAECVLFWIDSAFKMLMDAIEEISGHDSAVLVLETAGYRMGEVVASYYSRIGDIAQVLNDLPVIYGSAGWGKIEIPYYSLQEKKAVVRLRDSWEYVINKEQQKARAGSFLPGHWAGTFTGLFKENMWYRITKSQISGDDYDEFEFFASPITPNQNIHDLIRQNEKQKINVLEKIVAERTKELEILVQDLAVPVIPVLENIIVIPLMAKYDAKRAEELMEKALYGIKQYEAKYLLLDLTGLKHVDDYTVQLLHKLVQATRLLGSTCILVGISASLSQHIIQANYNVDDIVTFSTLQNGIYYALAQEDMHILSKK
ncbi:STAS domain-containing protein [Aneurinibacillus sp. REN35]|uniref:STAS domain-containing protein n=1 Tax=Aneurinibacillus sp. REN35 TaxID=3237286 RepID=UPI0035284C2D